MDLVMLYLLINFIVCFVRLACYLCTYGVCLFIALVSKFQSQSMHTVYQLLTDLVSSNLYSKPITDPYNEAPSSALKDESHDLSHDLEPVSEVSTPHAHPVYVPTGAEPR